jgi:hypothetical protein
MSLQLKAKKLGASEFGISKAKGKKYYVIYKGKRINFGAKGMSDYTIHKDKARRDRYRARHSKIKLKDGRLAYKVKESPAFWSYRILWS